MNLKWYCLFLGLGIIITGRSQSVSTRMGARAQGMANASSTLTDEWALWNNPGGLCGLEKPTMSFALHHSPALAGANRMASLAVAPVSFGSLGLGMFRFGDDLYNEHVVSLGYSNRFGIASLGVRFDYIQYRAEGFSPAATGGITLGGIATLSKTFSIGASVTNLNQPELPNGEPLPVKLTMSSLFKPTAKFLFSAEIEKDLDFNPIVKGGMEYVIHKKFMARSGFNLNPNAAFFGLGFVSWKMRIDYALQYSRILSHSHQISVALAFDKKVRQKE